MRQAVNSDGTTAKTHQGGSGNGDGDQGIGALEMPAVDIAARLNRSTKQSTVQGKMGRASPHERLRLDGQRTGGGENALPVQPKDEVGGTVPGGVPETHE